MLRHRRTFSTKSAYSCYVDVFIMVCTMDWNIGVHYRSSDRHICEDFTQPTPQGYNSRSKSQSKWSMQLKATLSLHASHTTNAQRQQYNQGDQAQAKWNVCLFRIPLINRSHIKIKIKKKIRLNAGKRRLGENEVDQMQKEVGTLVK